MIGISSYGAYVPRYRMDRRVIFEQFGWFNPLSARFAKGEKAVANYDEDSITMAVSAAGDCLEGFKRDSIDSLYMASISLPSGDRQNAVIVSEALNLHSDVRTADFTGALKSGTTALMAGIDSVGNSRKRKALVVAGEARAAKPGTAQEYTFGDGAAAFLISDSNVIAEYKGSYSTSHSLIDGRDSEQHFNRGSEARWLRDEVYNRWIPEAAFGLFKKNNLKAGDFSKFVIGCPDQEIARGIGKIIGAAADRIEDNLSLLIGDTGSALSLMMLIAALEKSKPGDNILVFSAGNGADALWFQVTPEIKKLRPRKGIKGHLPLRKDLSSYIKYLVFRKLLPVDMGISSEENIPTQLAVLRRENDALAALIGSRCQSCKTPYYPPQRICVNPECGTADKMEPYEFAGKTGYIASYTGDNVAFCFDPPAIYGLIDFEQGGRLYLDLTDCTLDEMKVGMPVCMSFRKKYSDAKNGNLMYFWKAVPAKNGLIMEDTGKEGLG